MPDPLFEIPSEPVLDPISQPGLVATAQQPMCTPMIPTQILPIGVYALSGLASYPSGQSSQRSRLLAVDSLRGYLLEVDPDSHNTRILNPYRVNDWVGAVGLAVWENTVWFACDQEIFFCELGDLDSPDPVPTGPVRFAQLDYPANGVAVWANQIYITCEKSGYIHVFDRDSGQCLSKMPLPGVGIANITATETELWLCDRTEQTVYCLDRATGEVHFSALTPYSSPTAIALYPVPGEPKPRYLVAYADEEPYIRDDPNAESPYQLTFRDRTFIHPLFISRHPAAHYTLSNGYLVEISYVEELLPLEDVPILNQVEWRMALPAETHRQHVRAVEPIGHSFEEDTQDGQRVAVFRFDELNQRRAGLVGWRAVVEMYGLKYDLTPPMVEDAPPLSAEFEARYLVDNDELAMDSETIQRAAKEAVGSETNVLRKALKIRNYVYDRMAYGIQPKIDTPDIALKRGIGSCGEYVGILLALFRLNGIACRTIGRYKCPQKPELLHVPLVPDYNHVWLEFYIPGIGWLPMESNVDDVIDRGPYPKRFFMGLAWYHTEMGKGIPFGKLKAINKPEKFSVADLAVNHIRFRILGELAPS